MAVVAERAITAPPIGRSADALEPARRTRRGGPTPRDGGGGAGEVLLWVALALLVFGAATVFVVATNMRPGYDAFGWLVWGRQVLHWNLNTDGAPSWKPLTFLFTLPYSLAGHSAAMWMWTVTSVAGAFAGVVFAARIAYRLTGPSPQRAWAPAVAAVLAGIGVLGIDGYFAQIVIANSEGLVVTLCLAAIDAHLCRRPRLAFAMLVLASLGRPEAWVFAGLYAIWAWLAVPRMRLYTVIGLALIPALWFTVPALTSKSWFSAGDLALHSIKPSNVIHGSKFTGVISRFSSLYGLPVQLTALLGVVMAAVRRDWETLGLAGAACLWIAVEIAFALHGWSGAARYLFEPAAVMAVIAAATLGRLLAYRPEHPWPLRFVGVVAAAALVVALIPTGKERASTTRDAINVGKEQGTKLDRLNAVIATDGGVARIRACGAPSTLVGFQSTLAWEFGMNVGNVGYKPGRDIDSGKPVVVFKPHDLGWRVHPFNIPKSAAARCDRLKADSAFG